MSGRASPNTPNSFHSFGELLRYLRKRAGLSQRDLAARTENENFLAQLRAKLGAHSFEEAWASGQAMSLEQAVKLALDEAQIP